MFNEAFSHTPVLLNEVLDGLKIKPSGVYVDATLGGAGHTIAIAKNLSTGKIFAFDKDPDAVFISKKKLECYNVEIVNDDFSNMEVYIKNVGVDGIIMDLGVSSMQLDNPKRGFSYAKLGPLDMRMSKRGRSAADIVNSSSKEYLIEILKSFGEEKFAQKIACAILKKRSVKPIETTDELADIVKASVPFKFKRKKNPCKKSFQALRIAVNGEFFSLKKGLEAAFSVLNSKGRLLVISFHSIEDRIVKNFYKDKASGCICSKKLPVCVCNNVPKAKIINKKPIIPSEQEIKRNSRAHCAKLRILEKI